MPCGTWMTSVDDYLVLCSGWPCPCDLNWCLLAASKQWQRWLLVLLHVQGSDHLCSSEVFNGSTEPL